VYRYGTASAQNGLHRQLGERYVAEGYVLLRSDQVPGPPVLRRLADVRHLAPSGTG
jgi:hypothetical protein